MNEQTESSVVPLLRKQAVVKRQFVAVSLLFSILLGTITYVWQYLVNKNVPEAYLDEVFHIRQAQVYCAGDLRTWDSKITTPPGLYLISWLLHQVGFRCDAVSLRTLNNVFILGGVFPLAFILRSAWRSTASAQPKEIASQDRPRRLALDLHAALNVALFPPLFFFSGLYYTDVASTAAVLACLALFAYREQNAAPIIFMPLETAWNAIFVLLVAQLGTLKLAAGVAIVITLPRLLGQPASGSPMPRIRAAMSRGATTKTIWLLGLVALAFRQTNVFWVGLYPLGIALTTLLRPNLSPSNHSLVWFAQQGFTSMDIFDSGVGEASALDYAKTVMSIVGASLARVVTLVTRQTVEAKRFIAALAPFLSVMLVFAAFVIWNGGVVLGDKSNHVATIHLPQMLYIWPYFVFFSLPLIYRQALGAFVPAPLLPNRLRHYARLSLLRHLRSPSSMLLIAIMLTASLAIIRFNFIIHPFTLADNRHYVFYVFRILRLYPALRYAAAPVCLLCAWLVIQSLGAPPIDSTSGKTRKDGNGNGDGKRSDKPKNNDLDLFGRNPTPSTNDGTETRTSAVLVWLAATTLCLVSAPLVEPRYYIVPWILWRLQVPHSNGLSNQDGATREVAQEGGATRESVGNPQEQCDIVERFRSWIDAAVKASLLLNDSSLWLETAWYIAINAVTGYIFLYRGFEWSQEPGHVQRFLW